MLKPPDFKQSRDTRIIIGLFEDHLPVTWMELEEATGKSRDQIRGAIGTAVRWMRRNRGIVIENDRSFGFRQRADADMPISAKLATEKGRRIHRVALEKMECVDLPKLTPEQRATHLVHKSVLELGLLMSRPRTIANVNQMVIRSHNELNEKEMLQAIKESLSGRK